MTVLAADLRAFAAAARKELRIMRRYPMLFLSVLFWPVLLPASWVLMGRAYSADDPAALAAFAARSGTADVAGFVFVGYFMYMWLSIVLWGPGTALRQEQMRGSLEAVFLTPASRLVALFGPSTAQFIPLSLDIIVMGVALWLLFGVVPTPAEALRTLAVIAIGVPALYGIGALFGAAVMRFGEVGPLVQLVRGTFVLACGITFPILLLPEWARAVAVTLPPTHIVAAGRATLLERATLGAVSEQLLVTAALGALVCALAVVVFRATERGAKRTGMLGRY